ncbi:MAG: DNA repair protein RadA [Rhizobiaceae bacterium]
MASPKIQFVCQNCGGAHPRWSGRCDACGEWNTLVEESPSTGVATGPGKPLKKGRVVALEPLDGDTRPEARVETKIAEFDRVTGGGLVRGSALLVGGDPGIGKSTLLMQASAALAKNGHQVVYVSGEEAVAQVRLRAQRLGAASAPVQLIAETNIENIITTLQANPTPALVVIDSIQTLWTDRVESAPGTVSQVRNSAQAMIRYAKQSGCAVVLVGHVTKEGQIAGPRVVEHMVDAVLYFEGEGGHHFRILRGVKNRFGPTDEIGVFEMSDMGLREVANPSELFLGERHKAAPGAAVFAGIEGRRPVLVEIQALVAESTLGTPRRAVVGWDSARLSMILAVLEAHCDVRLGGHDVYLNVAGGFRISEPAADLAVAAALVSSLANKPLPDNCVFFGEVSLSGHLRPVSQAAARLKEASKLGFDQASYAKGSEKVKHSGLRLHTITTLAELVVEIASTANEVLPQGGVTGT